MTTHLSKLPKALIVVLLLPLLVAGIGVWALKDRAEALSRVPAAVVNLDEGAEMEVDGVTQTVPFGRMLAGALTQPGTATSGSASTEGALGADGNASAGFDWRLTTEADATKGLKDGTYSAIVYIPKDFSAHLATMGTKDATQATVTITTNDASGLLDSLAGQAIAQVITSEFNNEMAQQYLEGVYLGFNSLQDGYEQAATGATQLDEGVVSLDSGATELEGGARQLSEGTSTLATGTNSLAGGTRGLATGARQLSGGLGQLARGADQVATGTESLEAGINGDGTAQNPGLRGGAQQLANGVNGDGTAENPGLEAGAQQLADGLQTYADGTVLAKEQLNQGLNDGVEAVFTTPAEPGGQSFEAGLDALAEQCTMAIQGSGGDPESAAAQQFCGGLQQTSESVPKIKSGIKDDVIGEGISAAFGSRDKPNPQTLITGADLLASGAQVSAERTPELVGGINELNGGIAQLGDGARELAPGARQIADGLQSSSAGARTLSGGADELSTGAGALATGAGELAVGADSLSGGVTALSEGTTELAGGSGELAEGLREGAAAVPTYTDEERAQLAATSAEAVSLDAVREHEVNGGSTATFPFAAALGLWLGAFGIFLLWPALRPRLVDSALPMWRVALASLIPAVIAAAVQAVLVLGMLVAFGVQVRSLVAVAAVTLTSAVVFAAVHQMLLTVFGVKLGRIISVIVLVLQVVALVGIVPLETAPPLLQSLTALMPLTVATQGLVHAALGGAIITTGGTLGLLALFGLVSFALTLVASRGARLLSAARRSPTRPEPGAGMSAHMA
ncbi:MAG: YhgE/Pip domain-containing protein [Dermabacter sp.]|nr:YhgE/Pip domain-containing protein [Dermabacter sp.]